MRTALLLSPHLDDVVFSCGGVAALLSDHGWHTVMATAFTRSVVPAVGFALDCQLDKGLPADADYMALRREEDARAAALLGIRETRWLDLLEAPHRGYNSAADLFGPILHEDGVRGALDAAFMRLASEFAPDLVFAPQGLGNHVDHQQVIGAAVRMFPADRIAFYRDTPYAMRLTKARGIDAIPIAAEEIVRISGALDRKIAASQEYTTQVGFQFGGAAALAAALREFASREGDGVPAERFAGCRISNLLS